MTYLVCSSSFIYHFQNCTALTTQSSATFSVSRISAAAPLTQAAASGSANEAIAATPNTGAAKGIKIGSYVAKLPWYFDTWWFGCG
jgi:uncharacterized protein (DUF2147 family)